MPIFRKHMLVSVVGVICCACHENFAVADGTKPACAVEAVDPRGNFTFSWQQITHDDAWFYLRNTTSTKQTLSVTLAAVTKPQPGPPLEALVLAPGDGVVADAHQNFTVPEHGAILFYLKESGKLPSALPASGSYANQLLLGPPCSGATSKPKPITITVWKVQPVLSKQAAMILRPFPWTKSWSADVDTPIRSGAALPDFTKGARPLGVLLSDSGGLATVAWTGTKDEGLPKFPEATLRVEQLASAGTYSGSIILADEKQGFDGKASNAINLTIVVKDPIYLPIAMIFVSVLIAFAVKRYLGVQRLIWNMGLEEASIGEEYREAERKFSAATAGKEYGKYSILKDLQKQRTKILGLISSVSKSWGISSIDANQDYKDASDGLLVLHHQLSQWGDLGKELAKLGDALSAALSRGQQNISDSPQVSVAEGLVVGKEINMSAIDQLSKDVLQSTQDLDGLVQENSGPTGPRLAVAMFGFGVKKVHSHSKGSPEAITKRRKEFLVRAIRDGDIAVAIFAVIIAELIGLNTKYLGFRAFGTAKDYVDLFVWGAGTKATLDVVTTLLDRVSTSLYRQTPRS